MSEVKNSNEDFFDILGQKLKLKKDEKLDGIAPCEVVAYVQNEVSNFLKQTPNLSNSQLSVLLALKFAGEKMALEKEYRESIELLHATAKDALSYIESRPSLDN